jgi:Protein of unknown function (DUF3160)
MRRWSHSGLLLALGACASVPPSPPAVPAAPPEQPVAVAHLEWPYWTAPVVDLHARVGAGEVLPPVEDPAWLSADEAWQKDATSIVARVREVGSARRRTGLRERGVGAFYEERLRRGAPLVLTFDALFAVAHVAFASAAAEVESRIEQKDLWILLHRLDSRLKAEAGWARPDLAEGYRFARSVVSVALVLLDAAYVVPLDLVANVSGEVALVRAHAGLAYSPLLGVTIDYGAMTPRGPIERFDDPRVPIFECAAWLAEAPFTFAGKSEAHGGPIDVGAARAQARAALILARLVNRGDAPAAGAFERTMRLDRFVLGDAEELSPTDVAETARRAGLDLPGGVDIADAAKLDRVRHLAAPGSMRLVPLRAPPDAQVLQRLVAPHPDHRMPSSEDVATWLGSLAPKEERHASFYGSSLEAMASLLRPSVVATARSGEQAAEREEVKRAALVAWTFLRHDALAFAHDTPKVNEAPAIPRGLALSPHGHPAAVFASPHPEAIANLLGAIRQLRAGLVDLGGIDPAGASSKILGEVESILARVLEASEQEVTRQSESALALVPSRIAALEAWAGPAADPVVIDVHVDRSSGRVLEEGTGPIDELFTTVHDSSAHRNVLAIGVSIPRLEREESDAHRLNDTTWRSRIDEGLLFGGVPE